jgi:hypothetical protein
VSVTDLNGTTHTVTLHAATLFEAAAAAIGAFRQEPWAADALTSNAVLRVEVQPPHVAHDVPLEAVERGQHNARAKRDRAIDSRTVSQADQFCPFAFGDHNFGSWPSDSCHAAVRSHMGPFLLENSVPGD